MSYKDKVIIIRNSDGSVGVIHPSPDMFDEKSKTRQLLKSKGTVFKTDEEVFEFIKSKDIPKGADYRIADKSHLPEDRSFREAWSDTGKSDYIHIDIPRAKEVKKNQFRELRKPLLEKLDIESMKAMEGGDTQALEIIKNKKQKLRDITKIEMPEDLASLKKFIPDELKDK